MDRNTSLLIQHRAIAERFEKVFERLLAGEEASFEESEIHLGQIFQVVTAHLMAGFPHRKMHWYDGITDLTVRKRKSHQMEFTGQMWVGDKRTQWKEPFRARVTDKRVTKQGIEIMIWIGPDRATGELLHAFGIED